MNRTLTAWNWSLGVVARSYRTVVVLAAFIALWLWAGYAWVGLPESSVLLLILALFWAVAQVLAAVVVMGGTVAGAAELVARSVDSTVRVSSISSSEKPQTADPTVYATCGVPRYQLGSVWTLGRKRLKSSLVFCLAGLVGVWLCGAVFSWVNSHSVEVASFLTFHLQKPISYVVIDKTFVYIEWVLWAVLGGFLLSFYLAIRREGWRGAAKQTWRLLRSCSFGTSFLTNLLSVVVFGGIAYELAMWHPKAPPGFWDYTQMIARLSLALVLISASILFWSLSLAGLTIPNSKPPGPD